jgi:hypothetical protein
MWQQIAKPDILIYLHCDYKTTVARGINWMQSEYDDQQPRLAHAREHADLEIVTDSINPDLVLQKVLEYINANR